MFPIGSWDGPMQPSDGPVHRKGSLLDDETVPCKLQTVQCTASVPYWIMRRSHATFRRSSAHPMFPIGSWDGPMQLSDGPLHSQCSLLDDETVPCNFQTVQCTASVPYRIMRRSHANVRRSSANPVFPIASWDSPMQTSDGPVHSQCSLLDDEMVQCNFQTVQCTASVPYWIIDGPMQPSDGPVHSQCSLLDDEMVPCKLQTVQCTTSVPYWIMRRSHANFRRSSAQPVFPIGSWDGPMQLSDGPVHSQCSLFDHETVPCNFQMVQCTASVPYCIMRWSHASFRWSSAHPVFPIASWDGPMQLSDGPVHRKRSLLDDETVPCKLQMVQCTASVPYWMMRWSHATFRRSSAQKAFPIGWWDGPMQTADGPVHTQCSLLDHETVPCNFQTVQCTESVPYWMMRQSHANFRWSIAQPVFPIGWWYGPMQLSDGPGHRKRSLLDDETVPCKLQTVQCTPNVPYWIMRRFHANFRRSSAQPVFPIGWWDGPMQTSDGPVHSQCSQSDHEMVQCTPNVP